MHPLLRRVPFGCLVLVAVYATTLSTVHFVLEGWKPHRVETAWILFGFGVLTALMYRAAARPAIADASVNATTVPAERVAIAGMMALTVAVYARGLFVGLLSDDFVLLDRPPAALGWGPFFRPLPLAVFWLIDRVDPIRAAGILHGLSLVLHLANGWLVRVAARRTGLAVQGQIAAMTLFLLFPASVEPVVWCAALQDVLAVTASLVFIVLALGAGPAWLMMLSFGAALFSKESAVVVPFIAAGLLLARHRRIATSTAIAIGTAAVAAVAFSVWRLQVADAYLAVRPSRYVVKNLLSMTFETLAVPWWVAELRRAPFVGIFTAAAVAAFGVCAVWTSGRVRAAPELLALVAWIVAGVLPVYTWLYVGDWLEGSRHLYFASAGWVLLLSFIAASTPGFAGRTLRAVLIVVALLWAGATYRHVGAWTRAAAERDRILAAARDLQPSGCASRRFEGVTDSVDGVYVFRNGFDEALRRLGIEQDYGQGRSVAQECRYEWNGTRFVPRSPTTRQESEK